MEIRDRPELKRVTRIDSIPAGSTIFDEQGFLHDTPIVTSTGIFEYGLPDGGVRRELRLPEYVFDKKSLASYIGKPVIITHDAGSIDKDNVMKEIVGTILSEGFQDGSDVRCKIVIHDIDKVKKIPYRELSLGYNLDLIEEPGEWNGEPYDAIQTNIRINHLAIVESARAGERAHLNLDGRKVEVDDKKIPEGGKKKMDGSIGRKDSIAMTPEELVEAINQYKAGVKPAEDTPVPTVEGGDAAGNPPGEKAGTDVEKPPVPIPADPVDVGAPPIQEEKKEDGDVGKLVSVLEEFLNELKSGIAGDNRGKAEVDTVKEASGTDSVDEECTSEEDNTDCSDDKSGSMNNDSADEIFRQRLSLCRMGDKLNMDGLEYKSILEGKKAIIRKVYPDMRLDGKSRAYVDAAYDLAVSTANKRKDVTYQKQQMSSNPVLQNRADGYTGSNASAARERMIEREGGNE